MRVHLMTVPISSSSQQEGTRPGSQAWARQFPVCVLGHVTSPFVTPSVVSLISLVSVDQGAHPCGFPGLRWEKDGPGYPHCR